MHRSYEFQEAVLILTLVLHGPTMFRRGLNGASQ